MRRWSYGINGYHKTAGVFITEAPAWVFALDWLADIGCRVVPRWKVPLLSHFHHTDDDGEVYTLSEWYGPTFHSLYDAIIHDPLWRWLQAKGRHYHLEVSYDECRAVFEPLDHEQWRFDDEITEKIRDENT